MLGSIGGKLNVARLLAVLLGGAVLPYAQLSEGPCFSSVDGTVEGVCSESADCNKVCTYHDGATTTCGAMNACRGSCMEVCTPTSDNSQGCRLSDGTPSTCGDFKTQSPPPFGNNGGLGWSSFAWANQSSLACFGDGNARQCGDARLGMDGNGDGNFWHGSVTHTALQDNPEWWGELAEDPHSPFGKVLEKILIYNRTDCCTSRLDGAEVWIHQNYRDKPKGPIQGHWTKVATLKGNGPVYEILNLHNRGAVHQIMVHVPGMNKYLSLAEVSVLAWD
jgi:hypothetical protein